MTYNPADIAASFQKAVVDVLVENSMNAVEEFSMNKFAIAGGVHPTAPLGKELRKPVKREESNFLILHRFTVRITHHDWGRRLY